MLVSRLHLVTDTRPDHDPLPDVAAALRAGADWVQVRGKGLDDRDLFTLTRRVVECARPYSATVVVDDRADVALCAQAQGVHLGAHDLPVREVRRMLGPDAIIGATARDAAGAREAAEAGADYVGVGPVFGTRTKHGLPDPLGVDGLARATAGATIPVIAIGGLATDRVPAVRGAGAHGVAVVSAVSGADDPATETARLLAAVEQPV